MRRMLLVLLGVIVSLLALEVAVRIARAGKALIRERRESDVPLQIVVDSPVMFTLNPDHPEVSSQGLRGGDVSIPKPHDVFRVLVLGDSIAYGEKVHRRQTFCSKLEELLNEQHRKVEVINAGVTGYTSYNELQYYLAHGRAFEADIVVAAFCLNDVANPRLHWDYARKVIKHIPGDAIPNHAYDALVRSRRGMLWNRSFLYRSIVKRLDPRFGWSDGLLPDLQASTPTYITGEDTLSIEVLLDETSPEWQWLIGIYKQLEEAVQADHGSLAVVLFPLAYQLGDGYPHNPQGKLADHFSKAGVACLDLLPVFRNHIERGLFLLDRYGCYDVWHLSEEGHALTAQALAEFLNSESLLPPLNAARSSRATVPGLQ